MAEITIRIGVDDTNTKKVLSEVATGIRAIELAHKQGKLSTDGARKAFTEIAREMQNAGTQGKTYIATAVQLDNANRRVKDGFISLHTELRSRATPAVVSLSQAFQDSAQFSMGFGQGLRAVANNVEYLSQQLILLHAQAGGTRMMLASIGQAIMGPMGILLGISVISSLAQMMVGLNSESKDAKKSVDELANAFDRLNKAKLALETPSEKIARLNAEERGILKRRPSGLVSLAMPRILPPPDPYDMNKPSYSRPVPPTASEVGDEARLLEIAKERADAQRDLNRVKEESNKLTKEEIELLKERARDQKNIMKEWEEERKHPSRGREKYSPGSVSWSEEFQRWIPNKKGFAGFSAAELRTQDIEFMGRKPGMGFDDTKDETKKTFDYIISAARQAGHAISNSIGGALREALGLGKDLGDQIFGIILQLGLNIATGGLMAELGIGGGGFGGFVPPSTGGGGGGNGGLGGGIEGSRAGGINLAPIQAARMSRGGVVQRIEVTGDLHSQGIYIASVRGKQEHKFLTQ